MKRIILSENSLQGLQDAMKKRLPDYVYQSVKKHDTSLGDSPCYPPSDDYAFDYKLLKIRYSDILDNIEKRNLPLDKDKAETLLYKLTNKAMKLEGPIRPQLVKLVENHVNKLFGVPSETINLTCSLTDTVKPDHALRIVPEEDSDSNDYVFNDVDEINAVSNAVKKRRFIDALIQGYSTITANKEDMYSDFLGDHSFTELVDLYGKITVLNDYLVFINKEHLDKKNPHLVAYVGVHLGHGDNRTEIRSQGILYPYLLKETIRGFMELFSSHGLPEDNGKAQILISKSDFAIAEPWDNRLGVPLWQIMFGKQSHALPDNVIPYFFSEFVSLPNDDFFSICQNLLMRTKKAQKYIKDMVANVKHDKDYQEFVKNIQQKNIDQSVITDGYMTADDLDNVVISEDGNLEENQETEDKYDDFAQANQNKHLVIFDDEYPNLQSLVDGVRNHTLLIHARQVEDGSLNDLQYGLDPTINRTILDAYAGDYQYTFGDYSEEEREEYEEKYGNDEDEWPKPKEGEEYWRKQMIPMVFASDDLTWCHDSRNGVIFVRAEGFVQKSPDTSAGYGYENSHMDMYRAVEADGQFSDWFYDDDVPLYVEAGDYFTDQVADVVAVLNLKAPVQESIGGKELVENQEDEYIDSPELSNLKYYLTMDDESKNDDYLYRYAASIYDFIKDKNWEYEFSDEELAELKDNDENDFDNNIDILKNHPDVENEFLEFAKKRADDWNENANDVFDYEKNIDVNKAWLIHFSEDAGEIAYKGFTKGTEDLECLALTNGSSHSYEGYNFAFLADEVTNSEAEYYCGRNSDNWGAVMFHANGIKVYHYGDEQHQVIFWGPSARDLVPIYHGNVDIDIDHYDDYIDSRGDSDDTWYVTDDKSPYGRVLYFNQEIEDVIAWVENNFFQYRKRLNYHTYAKADYEERARKRPQKS